MAAVSSTPGAGMLKGSPFLLYSDWKTLSDRPDLELFEQTNKARDILIRTNVILIIKNKEKQYADILDQLWKELSDLMGEYFDFSSLDGVNDWKNEYWKKLTHLLFGLYLLQAREEIIESESTADMKAPFSLTGGSHAD